MFSTIFGFRGQISRLRYFLLVLGLGFVSALLIVGVVLTLMLHGGSPHTVARKPSAVVIGLVVLVGLPFLLWASLALQAKRFRDMGWNPLYAILGWIAVIVLDRIVVISMPSLDFDHSRQSVVGVLINVVMAGCLLFWPSADLGEGGGENGAMQQVEPQPPAHVLGSVQRGPRTAFGLRKN